MDIHAIEIRKRVLVAAAKLFLEQGYSHTTTRQIAAAAGVNVSAMNRSFGCKENILAVLVEYVLQSQFAFTEKFVQGITDDPVLFYAAETTLQLHMAESHEHIRDLYNAAYSMPKTSDIIQHTITGELERIFAQYLPGRETKDFYELEIASGGVMRGFMTIPCNMYFTMDRKVARFIETTFLIYRVPDEKIREAVEFVKQFDFMTLAQQAVASMMQRLEQTEFSGGNDYE